jgi:uncharacterized protein YndB with AHSA1/START domain
MPRYEASRELLASRGDVWKVISEPYNLPDWWPEIGGVQPDRRGFAPGARWQVVGDNRPRFFRRPNMGGMLLVVAVEETARFAFLLTGDRLEVDLRLEERGEERTLATLSVNGPALIGLRRGLPQRALARLHALCQTAADF